MYIYYKTAAGKFHQLAAGQLLSSAADNGMEKTGGTARLSRTKSHLLGHSPAASKAGRRVGSATGLQPHWSISPPTDLHVIQPTDCKGGHFLAFSHDGIFRPACFSLFLPFLLEFRRPVHLLPSKASEI